jgi:hypothetical protein
MLMLHVVGIGQSSTGRLRITHSKLPTKDARFVQIDVHRKGHNGKGEKQSEAWLALFHKFEVYELESLNVPVERSRFRKRKTARRSDLPPEPFFSVDGHAEISIVCSVASCQ